jgi:antitoxin FitA
MGLIHGVTLSRGAISFFPSADVRAIIDSRTENSCIMSQLIVRQIEEKVVKKLKEQAGQHGVSMEEEHRRILRAALVGTAKKKPSFKEYLLSMPNVGQDKDFMRGPQLDRPIEL